MKKATSLFIFFQIIFLYTPVDGQILPYQNPTLPIEKRVDDLLRRMTMDEKIGQMMQIDLTIVQRNPSLLTSYSFGSVLSGGDSDPKAGNSAQSWADAYDLLQSYSLKSRLKIPMIYGVDAVHGHNNVLDATIFPHNIGLGCTGNPELVKQAARITAIEIAATGIDWTFAPCIAVPQDDRWGRAYEGFGETAELAQLLGSTSVRGFQADSLSHPTSILACSKHFLADGGTTGGKDQGESALDESALRKIHLPGYISSIDSGVGSIMASYNSINGLKMHANKYWMTDVLKNELGFKGFIVSDWAGIDQIDRDYKKSVELSINAGIDMVMLPRRYDDFRNAMRSLISEGKIDTSRVDDAVRRILAIKFTMGLFEKPYTDKELLKLIGSSEHRAVARQCVRESMVLLKMKDGVLPLNKSKSKILVAGSHADDIGLQCGGWTILWQGKKGKVTSGTTILQGMKNIAPDAGIEFSESGDFENSTADYSVVVIGEKPYAEGRGDADDLTISNKDVELIKKMKSYGAPVIVILISGRPLIIEKILHYADALFAAWLPGTEGDGIADVLFGDVLPKGKLSVSWPKSMEQIPINVGDENYDPLYAYGYGITSYEKTPIGVSPICVSSVVLPDGKHLELTFNKKMKNPTSLSRSFVIAKNHNRQIAVQKMFIKNLDSTTLILALDSVHFFRDDTVTVSYSGNDIRSFDGGVLQQFDGMRATNWVRPRISDVPGKIEAESYHESRGVRVVYGNKEKLETYISDIDAGDWMEYSINVKVPNDYYLSMKVTNDSIPGQMLISYGESNVVTTIPITNRPNIWETTRSSKISLQPGKQTVALKALTKGVKIDWISLVGLPFTDEDLTIVPAAAKVVQEDSKNSGSVKTIQYYITDPGYVSLHICDIYGNAIVPLVDEEKPIGIHTVSWDSSRLPNGVYIYKFQSTTQFEVQRFFINN